MRRKLVGRMVVQLVAGSVVPLSGARIQMPHRVLHHSERHTEAESERRERVP
jgi:hypothetical protein